MIVYAVRPSGVYLRLSNYRIVAINPNVRRFISDLQDVLARGVFAQRDNTRSGFYDIETGRNCFYIHVYHELRTVYLLARFLSEPAARPRQESEFQMLQNVG
jgi:hypothetical protein